MSPLFQWHYTHITEQYDDACMMLITICCIVILHAISSSQDIGFFFENIWRQNNGTLFLALYSRYSVHYLRALLSILACYLIFEAFGEIYLFIRH